MEKIKKFGIACSVVLGCTLMVGLWSVTPSVASLMDDAVSLIPYPTINNPVPQCSECLEERGLAPKCLNVCIQEVIINKYASKPYLECLAGK